MKSRALTNRPPIYRIYQIHQYIKNQRYPNVSFIADKLHVSKRTIERDVEYMRDSLRAPIIYSPLRKGYYYDKDFKMPPLQLTEEEILSLHLGQRIIGSCLGKTSEEVIKDAFDKIIALSDRTTPIDMSKLEEITSFNFESIRGEEEQIAKLNRQITDCISKQRSISIRYYGVSRDDITERIIDPYHLRYHKGAWYLIGYCHLRSEMRHFSVDRVLQLEETNLNFTVKRNFNLQTYIKSAIGVEWGTKVQDVSIHFDAYQARWIREKKIHHSQKIQEQEDGSLILSLKVNGLREVKKWVLGFGHHAKVMEPIELKQEIIKEIEEMTKKYF